MTAPTTVRLVALTIVCSWCERTIEQGEAGAPQSHGICADCERQWERKAQTTRGAA